MEVRYYGDKISKRIAKTPEGFLICQDVPISRTGFQSYLASEIMENCPDKHKVIHVYRPAEEVFNEKSLASFEGKPVTNEHPQEDVTPMNYHKFCCGHVQNVHAGEGEDAGKVLADLYITDPTLIQLIKDGKREVSCGYYAEEKRDAQGRLCQTKIRGNHVAVVNSGRAGKNVCIRDHKPKLDFNSRLSDLESGRHGLLRLGDRWLSRLGQTAKENLMGRYYYDDDDELLDVIEDDDDVLEEEDALEDACYGDDDDILEEEDVIEDDDGFGEEFGGDSLEDDDDILEEEDELEDDDELEEEDVLEDDDDLLDEDFEDAFYNDFDFGAAANAVRSVASKAGGAIASGAKKAGSAIASGAKSVAKGATNLKNGIASGFSRGRAGASIIGKGGNAAKKVGQAIGGTAGKAVNLAGKAGRHIKSGAKAAANFARANPLKTAAIAGGAGLGAGIAAGRASKDSWYPYWDDKAYWDDDEELLGTEDIDVEDDDLDADEEDLISAKADALLEDARRTLRDAKRKLYGRHGRRDAIILNDDDDELDEEEVEDDDDELVEEELSEDDGYGEEFDDDDEEEPIDESEQIDPDKTKALREITEASRGISDPHERKNVQDAIYRALCGPSQMRDVMDITHRSRANRMDSLFGSRGAMSVDGQQAIYDSFNPHKN